MRKSNPRNLTYSKVYSIALEIFGYDKDKTNVFWMSPIDGLGLSPYEMVKQGKGRTLLKFLQRCR